MKTTLLKLEVVAAVLNSDGSGWNTSEGVPVKRV